MLKRAALFLCMVALFTGVAAGGESGWKPDGDVTIRVTKAAGDTMDTISRLVGQSFPKMFDTNVMVVNMPGANGAVAAADLLANEPAPTEMLTAGIVLFTLAPLFSDDIEMNLDDWKFVSGLTSEDFVLVANSGTGLKNLQDVVGFGKKERLLVGTQASGGAIHMLATALFGENGVPWEAVTSNSSGKDVLACANGTVQVAITTTSVCAQFIEEGSIVPILTFGTEAFKDYPGFTVPTARDAGFEIVWRSLNFLLTRAEVSDADLDAMYKGIAEYCATPEFRDAAKAANIVPDICDRDACLELVKGTMNMCRAMYAKYYAK